MKLRYTPAAITDLREIQTYIKTTLHNPTASLRITKMIMDACASLKQFPKSGASIEEKTGVETDLRMLPCEHWVAIYRVDADCEMVSVARVVDGRQDYMRILFGEL